MSENAPTRSLDDIDLAALRVSIVIRTQCFTLCVQNYGRSAPLDVVLCETKCLFASDISTTIRHPRNKVEVR